MWLAEGGLPLLKKKASRVEAFFNARGERLFVIEAADKEEAVRIASLHPAATRGEYIDWGIELHPIGTCSVKR